MFAFIKNHPRITAAIGFALGLVVLKVVFRRAKPVLTAAAETAKATADAPAETKPAETPAAESK